MSDRPWGRLVEMRDVAPGLWLWRTRHPRWRPSSAWQEVVTSVCVHSGGEVALIDALAPAEEEPAFWQRLEVERPTLAVVTKPDHVRDVDLFVKRYDLPAYGPEVFYRDDTPLTELRPFYPGSLLPGQLLALYDGRARNERPLWLPEQRTLYFADALTEREGQLRLWDVPFARESMLRAMRTLLDLPFERVIISHGEPVHGRAAFERALELLPYTIAK